MKCKKIIDKLNSIICTADGWPLWTIGILLSAVAFFPFFVLGEGSVFEIHDQLDESMMNYVLTAKHLGEGASIFPEMLGGVNASGMLPAAVLFVPLYRLLPVFAAFILQYGICFLSAFFGMYLCVREITKSSILALAMGGCFCMLPTYPIYGLTMLGIPLVLYAFLCLLKEKRKKTAYVLIAFFGMTSHLVCTGYAVLFFWAAFLLSSMIKRKVKLSLIIGFIELMGIYVIVNHSLFWELLAGNGDYASHREEMVQYAQPFFSTVWDVFVNSAQHAPSLHKYLILPILILVLAGAFLKKDHTLKRLYRASAAGFVLLAGIALFYGICKSSLVTELKNGTTGFLRYFQAERFYWLYPAAWYLEFSLAFCVWWKKGKAWLVKAGVLCLLLLPTINLIKVHSYFYTNINQINNGSQITGYVTWESYYAEDLMQELEDAIGRNMEEYRVAHLGISPAPALMHGFRTADGYSNNYPLEYKHRFRQVIQRELAKNEETRLYFDEWGSRCYLFNSITGTYWSVAKNSGVTYEGLELNMEALKGLGCEYLFSGGEILDADRMGLAGMGYYETETSYWGIWLYRIQ